LLWTAGISRLVLAPGARQGESRQSAEERRVRSARKLWRAVAVAQAEADDAGTRFRVGPSIREGQGSRYEAGRNADIGVEQQQPVAAAETAALVDGAGETTIAAPAAQRDARPTPQPVHQRMSRRMIIDDHHLDALRLRSRCLQELSDQGCGAGPGAIV